MAIDGFAQIRKRLKEGGSILAKRALREMKGNVTHAKMACWEAVKVLQEEGKDATDRTSK